MLDSIKNRKKEGNIAYKVPKSTQDLIPIQAVVDNSGLFIVDNRYTKTFKFRDINYQMSGFETRYDLCSKWSNILNTLDTQSITQLTILNRPADIKDIDTGVYIDTSYFNNRMMQQVGDEFNEIITDKAKNSNGIVQEKFITVSSKHENLSEAVQFFTRITDELSGEFEDLGSEITVLDSYERLFTLHSFFHQGEEFRPLLDCESKYFGNDFKNYIAPEYIKNKADHMVINDKYCRGFYLISFPNKLNDSFIKEITNVSNNMVLSITILPVPIDESQELVEKSLRKHGGSVDEASEAGVNRQRRSLDKFNGVMAWDEDINKDDENMLMAVVTVIITEDSKDELDKKSQALKKRVKSASGSNAVMEVGFFQQKDILDTCLPYGAWRVKQLRELTTSSLAVMNPFRCIDIQEKNGIHIGENEISHNLILANMDTQMNQACITIGKPGGGKSMLVKWLQLQRILKTEHKYIIVDPEGEYAAMFQALCPELVTIVNLGSGQDRINCMEMVEHYGVDDGSQLGMDPVMTKSMFVMSLLNRADRNHPVSLEEKSLIDRCVKIAFERYSHGGALPTLSILRDIIREQREPAAIQLALKMEIFTTGTLNMFGVESNVNCFDSRVVIFNMHGLRGLQKDIGLFVVSDTIINMVTLNWEGAGVTFIDFDEAQVLLEDDNTCEFFDAAYRQWRKRNGVPNAITQNAKVFVNNDNKIPENMLSNSEIVIMMSQSASDLFSLQEYYGLSEDHVKWLKKSRVGCGLLKYGDVFIPFSNMIPRETTIYKLLSTKRNEGYFGSGVTDENTEA